MKLRFFLESERFTVAQTLQSEPGAFANICFAGQNTAVFKDGTMDIQPLKSSTGWRMLTVDAIMDFDVVGVLALISSVLAEEDIPIFVLSSFETDHILIDEKHLIKARVRFEKEGWPIQTISNPDLKK